MKSIKLRGKSKTQDPRLDRVILFDPRSKQYPIRTVFDSTKPRSRKWKVRRILDQGSQGSCVGHGWAHELIATPQSILEIKQADGTAIEIDSQFARQRIYWEAQKIDPWEGGSYPAAEPMYEGTAVICGAKVVQGMGGMDEYRWVFSLNDLILAIGYVGPVVLGWTWYSGMFNLNEQNLLAPTGNVVGGHCLLADSVNIKEETISGPNSWGYNWGMNGRWAIRWADADRLMHEDGEAAVPVHRHKKITLT